MYLQIREYIMEKFRLDEWTRGSAIPSKNFHSDLFRVGRNTVEVALESLVGDGTVFIRLRRFRGRVCEVHA